MEIVCSRTVIDGSKGNGLCNFSEGIEERGRLENAKETNRRMRDGNLDVTTRAKYLGCEVATVESWDREDQLIKA